MPRNVKVPPAARRTRAPVVRTPRVIAPATPSVSTEPGPVPTGDDLPKNLSPRFEKTFGQRAATSGGLAALAGLGMFGVSRSRSSRDARESQAVDQELNRRKTVLADMAGLVQSQSLEASIQANLAEVQRQSPFLYNQVAAGRVLPQGAVVLGGRTRQDLLQELGRSMSEGQFSQ